MIGKNTKKAILDAEELSSTKLTFVDEEEFAVALREFELEISKPKLKLKDIFNGYAAATRLSGFLEGQPYFSKYGQRLALCYSMLGTKLEQQKIFLFMAELSNKVAEKKEKKEISRAIKAENMSVSSDGSVSMRK